MRRGGGNTNWLLKDGGLYYIQTQPDMWSDECWWTFDGCLMSADGTWWNVGWHLMVVWWALMELDGACGTWWNMWNLCWTSHSGSFFPSSALPLPPRCQNVKFLCCEWRLAHLGNLLPIYGECMVIQAHSTVLGASNASVSTFMLLHYHFPCLILPRVQNMWVMDCFDNWQTLK